MRHRLYMSYSCRHCFSPQRVNMLSLICHELHIRVMNIAYASQTIYVMHLPSLFLATKSKRVEFYESRTTYTRHEHCICVTHWFFVIQLPSLAAKSICVGPFWRLPKTRESLLCVDTPGSHCSTVQHTATHCITLQHTASRYSTLYHTTIQCNALQNTATHCNTLQHTATHCNTLQHTATQCNTKHKRVPFTQTLCVQILFLRLSLTLQHTATYCNTMQHQTQKSPLHADTLRSNSLSPSLYLYLCLSSLSSSFFLYFVFSRSHSLSLPCAHTHSLPPTHPLHHSLTFSLPHVLLRSLSLCLPVPLSHAYSLSDINVYQYGVATVSRIDKITNMGWLQLVGSIKLQVALAEYRLFYRAL